MAAISWASGTPGDWKTAADWRGGIEPGAADDVTIDAAGTYAVTISVPEAAHSLTVNDAGSTIVDDAVLSLGSTLTLTAGTFQLNAGGVIKGGSLSATGGVFQWNGGTLNGVTYLGALDLSAAHSLLNVGAQGLTTNMIDLTGNGSELAFQNTQTFKNNVFIDIGSRTGASIVELDTTGAGATLTLAPGTQIIQTGRRAAIHSMGSASGDTIVNAGLIDAQFGGGQFTIDPNVFTNTNLIEVENGDTLFLQPRRFTNISGATLTGGYYNIGAGSTLQLSDNLTIAALDAVVFLGGVGAALQSLDTISGQEITLESTLATIAAHGALNLGTQGWSSTLAMTNTGSLSLSGGAFMAASLTNSGFLSGNGTIAAPLINSGVIDNASLSLAGPAMFDVGSRLNHTTLSVANATVAGLRATGANLNDVGMIDQTGSMTLDARRGDAGLSIAKGATYEIDGDVGIAGLGNRSFSAVVNDAGILIKSAGAGVGVVTARITDTGLVEVASGTLDVRLAVGGTGAMRIDAGATLELDGGAASILTANFNGAGAVLALGDVDAFAATIAGFTTGQTIDLIKTAATGATLGASDQLVIVNGTRTIATLQLTGTYSGDTFAVTSDGAGGSAITLVTPAPGARRFAQAMAGVGDGHGAASPYRDWVDAETHMAMRLATPFA